MFQFHYGTIKSKFKRKGKLSGARFQFHNGSIKSQLAVLAAGTVYKFQFHYGSIKSEIEEQIINGHVQFQFHNGSIKIPPSLQPPPSQIPRYFYLRIRTHSRCGLTPARR